MSFPRLSELRWAFSSLTVFIYWITYQAISQPEVFGVIRGGAGSGPPVQADLKLVIGREKNSDTARRGLVRRREMRIRTSLEMLMTAKKKIYLDPDIFNG